MVAEAQAKPMVAETSSKPSLAAAAKPAVVAAAVAAATQAAASAVEAKDVAPKPAEPRAASMASTETAKVEMKKASPEVASASTSERSSASGLLDRLRQGLAAAQGEPTQEALTPSPGLLARLRRALPGGDETKGDHTPPSLARRYRRSGPTTSATISTSESLQPHARASKNLR